MSNSDPNAFGSEPFVSQMASHFKCQTKLLNDLLERGTTQGSPLDALLHAIADDCASISLLEKAHLLNQATFIQRALLGRVITACYLLAAGEAEQTRYVRNPTIGTSGLLSATPQELIENARKYDPCEVPQLIPSLLERLDVIEQKLGISKDSFLVPIASVFSAANQILCASFYGQVFHLGVFQHLASMSGDRIPAHIREEFCSLFLTDIGLLDSVFKALAKRDKAVELSARSSQNWSAATTLIKRVKQHTLQLTWADGAWDRLDQLEFSARRLIEARFAPFEKAFRELYEAGYIVPTLTALGPHLDLRVSAMLLKRVLNDLRGVWTLLATGYTSQAASVAASLYESALASICLTLSQANIDRMLNNPNAEIPWSITEMTKMVVRSERPGLSGPKFETAWRALYANYVWLCQIKHSSFQSVLHDTMAASGAYAVIAMPNTTQEDEVVKAYVAMSAFLCTHDAIEAFACALGFRDAPSNQHRFRERFEGALIAARDAFAPYLEKLPPINIRRSRFLRKYPPIAKQQKGKRGQN